MLEPSPRQEIFYPYYDEEPVTESDWHGDVLMYLKGALRAHFSEREDVYVASNVFVYYHEGHPETKVSPDVFVCFGTSKHARKSYKTWEAGAVPQVVIEVTSESSRLRDQGEKRAQYDQIGVQEYYLFDPLGEYLPGQFRAYRRENDELVPVLVQGRHRSPLLGLDLVVDGTKLRLYKHSGEPFLTFDEATARADEATARADEATARADEATARAEKERALRERLEEELRQLRSTD